MARARAGSGGARKPDPGMTLACAHCGEVRSFAWSGGSPGDTANTYAGWICPECHARTKRRDPEGHGLPSTLYYEDGVLKVLDQLKLPAEVTYITCRGYEDTARVIKDMNIRGAPAIGVAAGYGLYLAVQEFEGAGRPALEAHFRKAAQALGSTRPTAVNLVWGLERMSRAFRTNISRPRGVLLEKLLAEAHAIKAEDLELNRRLGEHGSQVVPREARILTHCNAGSLATAGYGTAVGVIRRAHEEGKRISVWVDETRPYLQGARLTAWELKNLEIPYKLVADSMAGHLMQKGWVDLVVVGADRIARNGDVANKIGTYSLAVLARHHGIPFYVAAPLSTIDLKIEDGSRIPIEERRSAELTHFQQIALAPEGSPTYNPAFDITPHPLVTGIITPRGIARPPYTETVPRLFEED